MRYSSIILFLIPYLCLAQVQDDFSDGDFTSNPSWQGDLTDFIVNEEGQLQLNAENEGDSDLFLPITQSDSMVWEMYVKLDFAPSASNALRIYLITDNADVSIANGYMLEVGESGSNDAFIFNQLIDGVATPQASGSMGSMGSDPAEARMRITYSEDDFWSFNMDYDGGNLLSLDFQSTAPLNDLGPQVFFGLRCSYTSSRADLFFFDDVFIDELRPDTEPPLANQLEVLDQNSLLISFSEVLNGDLVSTSNFNLVPPSVSPSSVNLVNPNEVILFFDEALSRGQDYEVEISGIQDIAGNISDAQTLSFVIPDIIESGDLVINEILFDPYLNGEDFVEIYNRSDKNLAVNDLIIQNFQRDNDFELITSDFILEPDSYLAITPDKDFLLSTYPTSSAMQIIQNDLPAFNNDQGNVTLLVNRDGAQIVIDSISYDEDQHFLLLDDTEGVSLERIDPNQPSDEKSNWSSAATQVGFATPGVRNSSFIEINPVEGMFSIQEKTFSPNDDGDNDFLIISYNLDQTSYLGNAIVFDSRGRHVKQILSNESLATKGFFTWNGTNDNEIRMPVGIYIVWFEIFHPNGNVSRFKETCVLADFLK